MVSRCANSSIPLSFCLGRARFTQRNVALRVHAPVFPRISQPAQPGREVGKLLHRHRVIDGLVELLIITNRRDSQFGADEVFLRTERTRGVLLESQQLQRAKPVFHSGGQLRAVIKVAGIGHGFQLRAPPSPTLVACRRLRPPERTTFNPGDDIKDAEPRNRCRQPRLPT